MGVLVMRGVSNPDRHAGLEERKLELEKELRSSYAGRDRSSLKAEPTLAAYAAYYKRFKKTYHLQLQLESVVFKGKSIPRGAALVEAMFMAELKNLLLTAGHDLDAVRPPVRLEVAGGTERYTRLNGKEQTLKPGDMHITDAEGVLSSVIYGPDRRTRIQRETQNVLFTVYAPPGIHHPSVEAHLVDLKENVQLVSPQAAVAEMQIYGA